MKTLKITWILICGLTAISSSQAQNTNLSIELLWEKEFEGITYFNPDTAELMSTSNGRITIYNPDGSTKYSKKCSEIVRGGRSEETKLVRELNDDELVSIPSLPSLMTWYLPELFPTFSPIRNCFVEFVLWPDKSLHFEMFRWSDKILDYQRLWSIESQSVNIGDSMKPQISVSEKGFMGIWGKTRINKNPGSFQMPKEQAEIYNEKGALIASFEEGKDFYCDKDVNQLGTFSYGIIAQLAFSKDSNTIEITGRAGRAEESYTTIKTLLLNSAGKITGEREYQDMPERQATISGYPNFDQFVLQKKDKSFWTHSRVDKELKPLPITTGIPVEFTNDGKYLHFKKTDYTGLDRHLILLDPSTQKEVVNIERLIGEHIIDYSIATTGKMAFLLTCNFPPWEFKKVTGKKRYQYDVSIYDFSGDKLATFSFPASIDHRLNRIDATNNGEIFNVWERKAEGVLSIKTYSVKSKEN
jgi:hypothetical protein